MLFLLYNYLGLISLIIYADILIILNFLVDYFLLLLTAKLLEIKYQIIRLLMSAAIGGITSLYIFLPSINTITDFLYKLIICVILSATAFKIQNIKRFLKTVFSLFTITSLYAGLTVAIWHIFKPNGMVINNSIAYFDISPISLVGSTVIFYAIFVFLKRIFKNTCDFADKCEITVFSDDKSILLTAMVDSGNSVEDFFGKSEIIITDSDSFNSLFGEINVESNKYKNRFRIVPCSTVTGEDVLKGFRCDNAVVNVKNQNINIKKPILAVSNVKFNDDYNAIVNPKILK